MTRTLAGKIIGRHETARVDGGSLAVLLLRNEWRERDVALRGGFGAEHRLPEDEQRGEESGPVHGLPDGNNITVGAQLFRCAEVFFQPNSTGTEASGFHAFPQHHVAGC